MTEKFQLCRHLFGIKFENDISLIRIKLFRNVLFFCNRKQRIEAKLNYKYKIQTQIKTKFLIFKLSTSIHYNGQFISSNVIMLILKTL